MPRAVGQPAPIHRGPGAAESGASARRFSQAWRIRGPRQSVNRLTLYALEVISSKCSITCPAGRSS